MNLKNGISYTLKQKRVNSGRSDQIRILYLITLLVFEQVGELLEQFFRAFLNHLTGKNAINNVLIVAARDDACKLYLAIGHVLSKILIRNCENIVAVNKCGHRELRFLHIGHFDVCTSEELDAVFDFATL